MKKDRRISEIENMASEYLAGVDDRKLGLATAQFCMSMPKLYHVISFVMASSVVGSGGYLYLKDNNDFFSWFVVVSTGLLIIIMYLALEIWKKDYTPTYWRWMYDKTREVTASFSVKYYASYAASALTTVLGVFLFSYVMLDNSEQVENEHTVEYLAMMNRIKADTMSINRDIAEYKAANQVFINDSKGYVLNPKANNGLNALISAKHEAVRRGDSNLLRLDEYKEKNAGTTIHQALSYSLVTGAIFVLFEILVIICQRHAAQWCANIICLKEEELEELEELEEPKEEERVPEQVKERKTKPYHEKYKGIIPLYQAGKTYTAIAEAIGKSTRTVERAVKVLIENGIIQNRRAA